MSREPGQDRGLRDDDRRAAAARPGAAAAVVMTALLLILPMGSRSGAETTSECRVAAVHVLPAIPLADASGKKTVMLGGISDLASARATVPTGAPGRPLVFSVITDRGPNGTLSTAAGKRRTLLDRDFVPSIIGIEIDGSARDPAAAAGPRVTSIMPLADSAGQPLSGRPNGVGRDEPILDPRDETVIPPDPDGIDSEGLVRMTDGSFWVAEEYRPSLLQVTAEGRAVARFVPVGQSIPGAGMEIHEVLPAAYGARKDNRGFEALAVSPDQSRLWLLLQSPLEHPVPKAAKISGNVRLLAFDVADRRPVAEYVYRLGDPGVEGFLSRAAAPDDGKLCALAAIDDTTLLVLEQADGGLARLYVCSLADATDTLRRPEGELAIEQVVDLPAAGIQPLTKHLVADLSPLLPRMAHDVFRNRAEDAPSIKLEGMAILDDRHVVIVNDNDFGIQDKASEAAETARTCLWVVELGGPLRPSTTR